MPRLDLPASDGGVVALDALGPGRTVIYAYPLAAGPGARGCTPEACGLRDHHADPVAAGAAGVLGRRSRPGAAASTNGSRWRSRTDAPSTSSTAGVGEDPVGHPVDAPGAHAGEVFAWLRAHPGPAPAAAA